MVVEFQSPAPFRTHGLFLGGMLDVSISLSRGNLGSTRNPVVIGYAYAVQDRSGREHLAFHWHPRSPRSAVHVPHAHVSAALRATTPGGAQAILPLDKVHLPTGFLSLADIVRLLIGELGVEPRVANWQERLDRARPGLAAMSPT